MIAVVDYNTGNLRSVADALHRAGAEFTLTADPALLRRADRVILPGVGEASSAMAKHFPTLPTLRTWQNSAPTHRICENNSVNLRELSPHDHCKQLHR